MLGLHFITALVVENTSRNPMTRAFETIDSLSAQPSAGRRSLGRYHYPLMFAFLGHGHSRDCARRLGSIQIHLLLGILAGSLVAQLDLTSPLSAKQTVPEDKERLGEVGLDTPALVMNVVVGGVVGGKMLEWIPGEGIATVIVDSFDGRHCKEPHGLAGTHTGDQESNTSASRIQEESLNWVVVEGTESIWNVKTVVAGVKSH